MIDHEHVWTGALNERALGTLAGTHVGLYDTTLPGPTSWELTSPRRREDRSSQPSRISVCERGSRDRQGVR